MPRGPEFQSAAIRALWAVGYRSVSQLRSVLGFAGGLPLALMAAGSAMSRHSGLALRPFTKRSFAHTLRNL